MQCWTDIRNIFRCQPFYVENCVREKKTFSLFVRIHNDWSSKWLYQRYSWYNIRVFRHTHENAWKLLRCYAVVYYICHLFFFLLYVYIFSFCFFTFCFFTSLVQTKSMAEFYDAFATFFFLDFIVITVVVDDNKMNQAFYSCLFQFLVFLLICSFFYSRISHLTKR